MALIDAWTRAADHTFADDSIDLRALIEPWTNQFRTAIRTSAGSRKQSGRPRVARRAVAAAIDRVADAFLAVDTDSGEIVDANPAAGSLLGVNRDALLGVDSQQFVPEAERGSWWTELDAMSEDGDTRSFAARLTDVRDSPLEVVATASRFASKGRILALLMLRPRPLSAPVASSDQLQASDQPQASDPLQASETPRAPARPISTSGPPLPTRS